MVWKMVPIRRFAIIAIALTPATAISCSEGSKARSTSTTLPVTTSSTVARPPVPTTEPAAPGIVHVDLGGSVAQVDAAPDAVVATFTFGAAPDQLGFVPGQQADSITPSGFVLTGNGTAVIDDVVNRRLVRIAVPSGTRRRSLSAPDLCDGNLRLGPQEVLYVACQEKAAFGINAFATAGPVGGRRLAGPSGRTDPQIVQGTPIVFTDTVVTDTAGSARPLPYVTATGAPLSSPTLPPEPAATETDATTRITYRTGSSAPLRTWEVVGPGTAASVPISLTALPDATVVAVFAYDFKNTGRLLIARLTSHGIARAVSFPPRLLSDFGSVQANGTGAYLLESEDTNGARLVRYRLGD
jgi:hypothetical protein